MKKLVLSITNERTENSERRTAQFIINVVDSPEKFSGKWVRKALQALILKLMHTDKFSLGISRGRKVTIVAEFDGLKVDFAPIYFGGGNGAESLKEQLSIFVADLKEFVS